jgi:hypothetical protein
MSEPEPLACLRCSGPMAFQGLKAFHEGTRIGVFGDFFELFQNRESLAVFVRPDCGHVEFLSPGIGESNRFIPPKPPARRSPDPFKPRDTETPSD